RRQVGHSHAFLELQVRLDLFATQGIRHRHDGSFFDAGQASQHRLDLIGGDVLARPLDFASNSTITAYALASQINGVALVDPFTLLSNAFPPTAARRFMPKLAVQPRFLFSSKPRSLIVSEFVEEVRKTVKGMHQQLQAA